MSKGAGAKLNRLRRKSFGVIAIEVCFTLPVIVYLIFFTIELIKINITQDALQSICEEITYMTIAHDYSNADDLIAKGDEMVEKYRPAFIPKDAPGYRSTLQPVIRWMYDTYPMFGEAGDMLSSVPYGGSSITYPNYEQYPNTAARHVTGGYWKNETQSIPVAGTIYVTNPEYWRNEETYMKGAGLPNNRVFVLTICCNYPFSNSMVKWLFNGGVNTRGGSEAKGTMYLLWARGAGIVNAK